MTTVISTEASRQCDEIRLMEPAGYIGLEDLPVQVLRSTNSGYHFNLLFAGETGVGKSTLITSLFRHKFEWAASDSHNLADVELRTQTYKLRERNFNLHLTVVETVGYGDQVDKSASLEPINQYIDAQFEYYLQAELQEQRSMASVSDTRIHVCLFLICPTGHGLKALDIACLKQLGTKVNIIPVIAKADALSKSELELFIMEDLAAAGVRLYELPIDDEAAVQANVQLGTQMPFAVCASTEMARVGPHLVHARVYPWGVVNVEDETHCDLKRLRLALISTNMHDLVITSRTGVNDCSSSASTMSRSSVWCTMQRSAWNACSWNSIGARSRRARTLWRASSSRRKS